MTSSMTKMPRLSTPLVESRFGARGLQPWSLVSVLRRQADGKTRGAFCTTTKANTARFKKGTTAHSRSKGTSCREQQETMHAIAVVSI